MSEEQAEVISNSVIDENGLNLLFRNARTHRVWQPRPVTEKQLRKIYDLARLGPTSSNSSPARFVFLVSPESKERLLPALSPGNVEKSRTAGAVTLIAYDLEFYKQLPKLAPHLNGEEMFAGKEALIRETVLRDSSLQGAYFILAARAIGLDCGPMVGFDAKKVNEEFFPDGKWEINFVCNLGYGDGAALRPRAARLDFEEACVIL
jgi:3-hydroxypropanoate dehydrogenase